MPGRSSDHVSVHAVTDIHFSCFLRKRRGQKNTQTEYFLQHSLVWIRQIERGSGSLMWLIMHEIDCRVFSGILTESHWNCSGCCWASRKPQCSWSLVAQMEYSETQNQSSGLFAWSVIHTQMNEAYIWIVLRPFISIRFSLDWWTGLLRWY